MRKRLKSEEIFYNTIKQIIKNQLINDPNFTSTYNQASWYERNNKMHYGLFKEKGEYILEELEKMKHLIIDNDSERSI